MVMLTGAIARFTEGESTGLLLLFLAALALLLATIYLWRVTR